LNYTGFSIPPPDLPLGVLYVASALESDGHNVIVRDLCRTKIENEIWEQIQTGEIALVGISFLSFVRSEGFRLCRKIKSLNSECHVVAGGLFPTSMPYEIIDKYPFDSIACGEGEGIIVELAGVVDQKCSADITLIRGIYSRSFGWCGDREPIKNLDEINFPAWHHSNLAWFQMTVTTLIPNHEINGRTIGNKPWAPIIASRGCVGRCVFCNAFSHWGDMVRFRSAENILDEVEILYHQHGVRLLAFNDDAFPLRKSQCVDFCNGLIDRKLNVAWQTTTRGDVVDADLCELMHRAGCFMVAVGVESGSPAIHANLKKHLDLDRAAQSLKLIRDAGMISYALLMIGNPGESNQTIAETQNWLLSARPNWYSFVRGVLVVPGTELCNMAIEHGQFEKSIYLDENVDGLPIYTVEHPREQFDRWAEEIESVVPRSLCIQ
jgi:radical SAM superfamily enzyme YgiQ (UPF0313 family)